MLHSDNFLHDFAAINSQVTFIEKLYLKIINFKLKNHVYLIFSWWAKGYNGAFMNSPFNHLVYAILYGPNWGRFKSKDLDADSSSTARLISAWRICPVNSWSSSPCRNPASSANKISALADCSAANWLCCSRLCCSRCLNFVLIFFTSTLSPLK